MKSTCKWCGRPFAPRGSGGKPQHFCQPACRRALDAAGRRWIAAALADGRLTIDALRNGLAATRALPADDETPPAAEETVALLDDVLAALLDDAWLGLPDDLLDRLGAFLAR